MAFDWYQRWKIVNISHRKPLMLKIETTNACNAKCCFCAYVKSKRHKSILSMELYEKALEGYSSMGGGPFTLTPVVGDVLLDPYLLDRLGKVSSFPAITDVSFTTNLIAHEKLSDEEWADVLRQLHYMQISLGGYDQSTYAMMFGVEAFDAVWGGLLRIAAIKKRKAIETRLAVTLRAPDATALMHHDNTRLLREIGYNHISGISVFGNWCGDVTCEELPEQTEIGCSQVKTGCCVMPALFMAVLSNGRVTGCSCVDHEGVLEIGNLYKDSLRDIWHGMLRAELCSSFENGALKSICSNCSSYISLQALSGMSFWDGVGSKHVSTSFYDNFSGG